MSDCIFCQRDNSVLELSACYACLDRYPLAKNHVEIVPFRHVQSFFDLEPEELRQMWRLAHMITAHHADAFGKPDGYTLGINDGPAAGQTIPHCHLHVIPRHVGDVPNPRGGIRNVFPNDAYSQGGWAVAKIPKTTATTINSQHLPTMWPCRECGEDVPASECYYDDFGGLMRMHAVGVTGSAEPHETGYVE